MTSKIFNIGIVGSGMISDFHAQAIAAMDNARLVAVYNHNIKGAEKLAEKYDCKAYSDYQAFLAHPDMQIVNICTPSGAHLEPGLAAAKAGKHLIVEKPLEVTIEKTDQLIAVCEQNDVQLCSILPRRFNRATQVLKQAVEQGRFGKISLAEASIKWYRTQAYYDSGAWRGTWELDGGGALMNQSIHTVDLLLHVMGDVTSVSAFASLTGHEGIEVEDTLVAILNFKNGAKGVIQAATTCYSATGHPAQVQICGTEGSVFMVDDKFSVFDFKTPQPEDEEIKQRLRHTADSQGAGAADPSAIDFSWHQKNISAALTAIENNTPFSHDGYEGRKAIELIGAIYQAAAQQGQPVQLPLKQWPDTQQLTQVLTK